jgi:hypothetical protein
MWFSLILCTSQNIKMNAGKYWFMFVLDLIKCSVCSFHRTVGPSPLYLFMSLLGLKEAQWSPLADSERKDSLSVNVEFVKFHLSRSRKLNFQCEQQPSKGLKSSDQSQAVIRFSSKSLICCSWCNSNVIRKVLYIRFWKMKIYYLCEYFKKRDALMIEMIRN